MRMNRIAPPPSNYNWNYTSFENMAPKNYSVVTEFEELMLHDGKFYKHYEAWFIPPKTTRYRFYVVCND